MMRAKGEVPWAVICIRNPRPHRNSEKIDWLRCWPVAQQRSLFIWRANDLMSTLQTSWWCCQHPGSATLREIRTVTWLAVLESHTKKQGLSLPLMDMSNEIMMDSCDNSHMSHFKSLSRIAKRQWWTLLINVAYIMNYSLVTKINL